MSEVSLFFDLDGVELTVDERELLKHPLIGGVILFARNTKSAEQVAQLVKQIRQINPEAILSIDQEGGRVQRLKTGVTSLPPVQAIHKHNCEQNVAMELGWLMAVELGNIGIDISFAPVLDLDYGHNAIIGNRAFATDIDSVISLSSAYIKGMKQAGMAATGKHFPGHGWVKNDTHLSSAIDERSFAEIWDTDIQPFHRAISQGMEAIMLAHVNYPACDANPAGFSSFWLQEILRNRMNFKGIIFSDDLSMKAAASVGGYVQRAICAIEAGCQVLLCCNERQGVLDILNYLEHSKNTVLSLQSLKSKYKGKLNKNRLKSARILAEKLEEI